MCASGKIDRCTSNYPCYIEYNQGMSNNNNVMGIKKCNFQHEQQVHIFISIASCMYAYVHYRYESLHERVMITNVLR